MKLEAARPAACTGPGWKKKETGPAEERESSRLELLVWLRGEMLPKLPLIGVQAAGKGGYCCCCCWDCGGGERETFCRKERGREGGVAGFGEVAE